MCLCFLSPCLFFSPQTIPAFDLFQSLPFTFAILHNDWGRAYKTVIRPVQVLQNRTLKYLSFSKRISSANNIFKLLKILKVSDLYQLNLEKFMYKYNADILPSSFDNFFSELHCIHDHATRQQVLGNYHHKRVRTDYGKKMLHSGVARVGAARGSP